jgi:Protein of unknown function (DUF2786)
MICSVAPINGAKMEQKKKNANTSDIAGRSAVQMRPEFTNLMIALQPDGKYHVVIRCDRWLSICRLRLKRYEERWNRDDRYVADAHSCPQCLGVLNRRAPFPKVTLEEQKTVIDRIKKLLALHGRETTNEHEAALAAAKAEELLRKYNLDIGVAEDPDRQRAEKRISDSLGIRVSPYKYTLASAMDCQFDVEHYISSHWMDRGYEKCLVFLGLPANVEAAVITHSYLCATVEALYRSV